MLCILSTLITEKVIERTRRVAEKRVLLNIAREIMAEKVGSWQP